MLALSQTTGYAILALSCLDGRQEQWVLAKSIAQCTGIPLPYLSKLMHALAKSQLVRAKRGYRGGFQLARPADQISLLEVANAVEGPAWLTKCLLGLEECSDQRACPMHAFWIAQRAKIEHELTKKTLHDVAQFEARRGVRLKGCNGDTEPPPEAPPEPPRPPAAPVTGD